MNDPLVPQLRSMPDDRPAASEAASTVLPIVEESIVVEKVEVDRGGYRLTKRVGTRDVLVDEPLRHRKVSIERRVVDRPLADGEMPTVRYEGDTMIVPVVREVVVAQKRLVLVEEIRIVRSEGTHRDPRSVSVREEFIEVERLGAEPIVDRLEPARSGQPTIREDQPEHIMNAVLVGMFDTEGAALAARDALAAAGFAPGALQLTGGPTGVAERTTSATSMPATTSGAHSENAITRFFENLFGSDETEVDLARDGDLDRHRSAYAEAFRRGSFGLTVQVASEDESDRAERILNDAGAIDIDERSTAWKNEGRIAGTGDEDIATGTTRKLQEVEETMAVGKRFVDRGGVRVFTRVTEVPVEQAVMLREQQAVVTRTAVDRVASAADLAAFEEGSIEVRETGEEAVVRKTARVTGEVEVGKTVVEHEETIRDTVRQSKVEVERIAGGDVADGFERGR